MFKRKSFLSIVALLTILLVGPCFTGMAKQTSPTNSKKNLQVEMQKKYNADLKKLGFPDSTIEFLTSEEIESIVKNSCKFESVSTTHTLFIHVKDSIDGDEIGTPLTENEFKEYKQDKNKILNKKILELSKEKHELERYTTLASQVSQTIDAAVLTLSCDSYDDSTDGYIYKVMGTNWKWDVTPFWTLTDAVAVSFTGSWWNNIAWTSGYYYYDNTWVNLTPDPCGNGASETYDIISPWGGNLQAPQEGRISVKAGNFDSQVPRSLYTVWGTYGHTRVVCTGVSVSINTGGVVSIGLGFGTQMTQVDPKPVLNNQVTY